MAWNKLLECRDELLPEWKEKAQGEDLLARFRAMDFMQLTENAQPIQKLDIAFDAGGHWIISRCMRVVWW